VGDVQREQLVKAVERSWQEFDAAVAGLDETTLEQPGVVGDWSIKDVVGHIASWEQVALRHIERWRNGDLLIGLGEMSLDAYNATQAATMHAWSAQHVRDEAAVTRANLRAALGSLTDDDWAATASGGGHEGPLGDWVGNSVGGYLGEGTHAAEHALHIWAWRTAREDRRNEQSGVLVEARCRLLGAIRHLSDADLTRPGYVDKWSIQELLGHIAAWDREMMLAVESWLTGTVSAQTCPDVDAFNARVIEQIRDQSLGETLRSMMDAHVHLLAVVRRAHGRGGDFLLPWGERGDLSRAAADMAAHDDEHADEILAWRRRSS
jgi:uncharacterized damage-inducible protein DinB